MVKNLSMQETQNMVLTLNQEDPLEKEMATHSSNSCLEDSMGKGAWWPTVHGAAKSPTQLSICTHTHCTAKWLGYTIYIYKFFFTVE